MKEQSAYLGEQPHWQNLGGATIVGLFGAFLVFSGPLFGFAVTFRRLPPIVTQVVGGIALLVAVISLVVLDRRQARCLRCKVGLEEGEAAFPEELEAQVRPLLRAMNPRPLLDAPVGSRFGKGPHAIFHFCPTCKSVGLLSLHRPSAEGRGFEIEKQLVVGEPAQLLVQICEVHERVRNANNQGA